MDVYLEGLSPRKRALYKVANFSLYPTIFSIIGFAYISAPQVIQLSIRRELPLPLRESMLSLLNTNGWLVLLFGVTVLCAIWGSLGGQLTARLVSSRHKETTRENQQLREESDSKAIDCYKVFSNYLFSYFSQFGLGSDERISLYKLDMEMFSCVGRYSDNEIFNSKPSRLYPRNQGCIARAWEVGNYQDTQAPDPQASPYEWVEYNIEKYGYDEAQLDKIRMKSRAFLGVRLKNSEQITIAVIIFESLRPNGLPFGKINSFLNDHEIRNLANLIQSLEKHMPSLEEANAEGF